MGNKDDYEIKKALALFTQLGFTMASCVIVGVLAGKYLDRIFGTSPCLLLVFAFFGAAAAFKSLYDLIIKGWGE